MKMKRLSLLLALLVLSLAACASAESAKPLPSRAEGIEDKGDENLRAGNVAAAKRRYETALRDFRRNDDLRGTAAVFIKAGKANMLEGNAGLAGEYFAEAKRIAVKERFNDLAAEAALSDAMRLLGQGDAAAAEAAVAEAAGHGMAGWKLENAHGRLAMAKGDHEAAKKRFTAALDAARGAKDLGAESACRANLGILAMKMNRPDEALTHLNRALSIDKAEEAAIAIGETLHLIGMAYEQKGDHPAARYFYLRAYGVNCAGTLSKRTEEDQAAIDRVTKLMNEVAAATGPTVAPR